MPDFAQVLVLYFVTSYHVPSGLVGIFSRFCQIPKKLMIPTLITYLNEKDLLYTRLGSTSVSLLSFYFPYVIKEFTIVLALLIIPITLDQVFKNYLFSEALLSRKGVHLFPAFANEYGKGLSSS